MINSCSSDYIQKQIQTIFYISMKIRSKEWFYLIIFGVAAIFHCYMYAGYFVMVPLNMTLTVYFDSNCFSLNTSSISIPYQQMQCMLVKEVLHSTLYSSPPSPPHVYAAKPHPCQLELSILLTHLLGSCFQVNKPYTDEILDKVVLVLFVSF